MRTVKEWIDFLGNDEEAVFALRSEEANKEKGLFPKTYYLNKTAFMDTFSGWSDDLVIKVWHHNLPNHHLLIIK